MSALFDTPLRAAALGVLMVAVVMLVRGLVTGRRYRDHVMVLSVLALGMVLISEVIQ
ncbi:MAG: hypothetical protein AAF674_06970 [Pseudomonadota bacterium]